MRAGAASEHPMCRGSALRRARGRRARAPARRDRSARAAATSSTSSAGTCSQRRERAQRDQAVLRERAPQRRVGRARRSGFPSPSSRSRSASGSGSRRISSESSMRPQPSTCGRRSSQSPQRVVADRGERDGRVQRELLVAADDAEEVGVLAPAEPAHQRHRVLDLVAVARAQEDLVELRVEAVGVRGRIRAQAIAQRVDAAAHVALAEELAHAPVAARVRLRRERDEGGVDALDGVLDLGRRRPARRRSPRRRAAGGRPRRARGRPAARERRCARRSRRVPAGVGEGD